jgi:hypothetical protein
MLNDVNALRTLAARFELPQGILGKCRLCRTGEITPKALLVKFAGLRLLNPLDFGP